MLIDSVTSPAKKCHPPPFPNPPPPEGSHEHFYTPRQSLTEAGAADISFVDPIPTHRVLCIVKAVFQPNQIVILPDSGKADWKGTTPLWYPILAEFNHDHPVIKEFNEYFTGKKEIQRHREANQWMADVGFGSDPRVGGRSPRPLEHLAQARVMGLESVLLQLLAIQMELGKPLNRIQEHVINKIAVVEMLGGRKPFWHATRRSLARMASTSVPTYQGQFYWVLCVPLPVESHTYVEDPQTTTSTGVIQQITLEYLTNSGGSPGLHIHTAIGIENFAQWGKKVENKIGGVGRVGSFPKLAFTCTAEFSGIWFMQKTSRIGIGKRELLKVHSAGVASAADRYGLHISASCSGDRVRVSGDGGGSGAWSRNMAGMVAAVIAVDTATDLAWIPFGTCKFCIEAVEGYSRLEGGISSDSRVTKHHKIFPSFIVQLGGLVWIQKVSRTWPAYGYIPISLPGANEAKTNSPSARPSHQGALSEGVLRYKWLGQPSETHPREP
ncbi:hypothetical protein B0H17DRAFT_1148682 [Mycena rosella]|uniref:Uncharacterized protein n=1 Tax=Mycena rosella TaxID=1033263 RepID=A0AAD7C9E2_MYCRO|nr:hypothetical protein B0H17DRAFT_1148682 [Mycena rosella]